MPIPAHVINALTQFISTAGLEGQAILIGGQAIRDWHDEQAHKLGGIHGVLPTPRATSDIDVHLAVKVNPDAMTAAIMGTWTPDPDGKADRPYRFFWNQDDSVSLDLIALNQPAASRNVAYLVKIGTGAEIGAVRVLAPWIIACQLHERCFTPEFARLKIRRLTRLGLVAAKITAVNTCVSELIKSGRARQEPASWTGRLAKDLQDMDLLLQQRIWVDDLWEAHYQPNDREITRYWTEEAEAFRGLRERPSLMSEADFVSMQRIADRVSPRLYQKAWERE